MAQEGLMTMNLQEEEMGERPLMNRSESAGEAAMRKVERYENASKLVKPAERASVNKLCWEDIELGRLLDKGSFSCVYEATLRQDRLDPARPVYAVKCLRDNVTEQEDTFVTGAVDLALEANILAKLMHPNIIRLHGSRSGCISEAFQDNERGFFIVLDLLADTLDKRLTRWRRERNSTSFSPFRSKRNNLQARERIEDVAVGVAAGLEYLHSRHIIYRDLKPHNIGFDEATGTVKIFDFGLAREADSLGNLRQMTGNAGTPRYMAPEVAKGGEGGETYGFPSDVYSFSILLWEIMTLDRPFDNIKTLPQFNEEVVRRHERPPLKKVQSPELKSLLEQCWDKDQARRPVFSEVCQVLRKHLADTEPKFRRSQSTLSSQKSSMDVSGSSASREGQQQNFQDSATDTQVTSSGGSSLMSSRRTNASEQDPERKSSRLLQFLSWRRKPAEVPELQVSEHSYRERTWVERKLLRKPTMRLDLSLNAYPLRRYDLGRPGSFRSSGSIHSGEEGGGRRPSMNSTGSGQRRTSRGSTDEKPQRRRSSGKSDSNRQIEAMAAALAAEAESNRQFLRELKREKNKNK